MVETRISLLNRRGRRPRRPENTNGKNKHYGGSKPPPYECYSDFGALPWQPIFISAQGSPNTTKTVGGEAVRRFFSLSSELFYFTVYALFREPNFAIAKKISGKFFAKLFFKKA